MALTFHHIHLVCSDLGATEGFFVDLLGARLVTRTSFGGVEGSKLRLGEARIYLRSPKPLEEGGRAGNRSPFGFHHIGLETEDLEKAHADLVSRGAVFTVPPRRTPTGGVAFLEGPDEIVVELYQANPAKP